MIHRYLHTRDRGAVLPIVALLLPVLMLMTAFAVDLGRQRALRRDLQADADVIALDLVRLADGRTMDQIVNLDPTFLSVANESFTRNGLTPMASVPEVASVVTYGRWDAAATPQFDPVTPSGIPNSVRVSLEDDVDYFFQPGTGGAKREAYAVRDGEAVFSIGSRLASVDTANSPLIDPVLDALFQGLDPINPVATSGPVLFDQPASMAMPAQAEDDGVSLSALSYEGLAGNDITIRQLIGFIPADVDSETGAASPEQVLASEVKLIDLVQATASALDENGDGEQIDAAVAYLGGLSLVMDQDATVQLDDLLSADVSSPGAVLDSHINAWDLLLASVQAVNGNNLVGTQVALPPGPFQSLPLVSNVVDPRAIVTVAVIEGPQFGRGRPGGAQAFAETSQIRLGVDVGVTLDVNIASLLPLGSLLPSVATVNVDIPVNVTVGDAAAALTGLDCNVTDPTQSLLDLDVTTDAAKVRVGAMTPGQQLVEIGDEGNATNAPLATVSILGIDAARVNGSLTAPVGASTAQTVSDLQVGQTDNVAAPSLGLRSLLASRLSTEVLGYPLVPDSLINSITGSITSTVLLPMLDSIDQSVVAPLLDLLGADIAGADVTAVDAICDSPKLIG
ncbi:pilus assembly protein TadG-related protein [Acidimicrobiia bacterium EGI L10123]|uniref:pilus assembly protein TadG-related protein n=1 Tax=Salinilacustrithrix flava TaxID=2957203 RepID=UPI003D7C30FF|nr:pilus assembly protein TadG-related protein [Acidimicrobiia bacterium EGI L10123]